ncbi:MAG: type IV secretion system DNA-binding domain-containing protein [Patescibacteria group bacterium]|nr:type IV secretion system DNA-binding domain-containing protein [Patescibacteria group bacterium]
MDENRITYFAETDARNKRLKFGIKAKDRTRHVYVLGKTGMGKSTLLENMAVQDIQNGEGMCFIDPHGKTADLLMEYVPKERIRDVIYIAPFDTEFPISFNVLESVDPDKRHLVVSGLMSTFKKIWVDAWSARMEYILTNTLLALLEAPGSTLLGVNRMLSDKPYRLEIISHIKDPSVKAFWTKEFANYTERQAAEAVPAIQNKVGQFTANPLIRNMIGQPVSSFDFRQAMDRRKIMIINLSKGKIGDENMKLLGGLLVTKIYLAAMSRADIPDRVMKIMPNFYLYVDEFQNFANASFADILSEARKYKLNLTIAHQYVEQMDEIVRPAVFGNVGTMIVFRVGASDAEILEKEFAPQFTIEDLVNLGFAQIYLKLMIDGLSSAPFSATTLPPIVHPDVSYVNDIIAASREQFSKPRAAVEAEIIKFHEPVARPAATPKSAPSPNSSVQQAQSAQPVQPGQPVQPIKPPTRPTQPTNPDAVIKPTFSPGNESPTPAPTPSASMRQKSADKSQERPAVPYKSAAGVPSKESQTHQPFKSALAEVLKGSVASVPLPKPVSLSSLAPKQPTATKPDPKKQSPENVKGLKDALASILAKTGSAVAATPAQTTQSRMIPDRPANQPANQAIKPVPKLNEVPKLGQQPIITKAPIPSAVEQPAGEVPEEVLKKVLKVD